MTEWKTREWVEDKKETLLGEDISDNKNLGRRIRVYSNRQEAVGCSLESSLGGHPLGSFHIMRRDWEGHQGLEQAYIKAGYEVVYDAK